MSTMDPGKAGIDAGGLPAGLYVVATPIGHLGDLSARAVDTLKHVDVVAAEDTRVARVLLDHVGVRPTLVASHAHNEARSALALVERVQAGQRVALISDAGTPGISDPGARVVAAAHAAGVKVIPVPGPSAIVTLLSVAGFAEGRFRFEGFLPARPKARRERLDTLSRCDAVVVLYESPHRIVEMADDLAAALEPGRIVMVGRELTKRFEQLHRCTAAELPAWLQADSDHRRGEFVVAFDAAPPSVAETQPTDALLAALCTELPVRQAARIAARATGLRANDLYRRALSLRLASAGDEAAEAAADVDADEASEETAGAKAPEAADEHAGEDRDDPAREPLARPPA
jgi:16S rRNA (cytidine1402-2'-O)-methyltransferase